MIFSILFTNNNIIRFASLVILKIIYTQNFFN